MNAPTPPPQDRPVDPARARRSGAILQGLVVGGLLVPAILQLLSLADGVAPFTYQGF